MTMEAMDYPVARPAEEFGFRNIIYSKSNGVALITLNRPHKHNCLNFPTMREVARAIDDAAWDDAIDVVVVTGAGDAAFCTGADLDEQTHFFTKSRDYHKWMGAFVDMIERVLRCPKITIARINGICVGGGNELQMACDFSVMVDDAYIRHVGTSHGSVPAGGATQWLTLLVGDRKAREIIFLGQNIPALQCQEWGLVTYVVTRQQLDEKVNEIAANLRSKLPECTRYAKQQLAFWKDFVWSMTIGHARDWLTLHAGMPEVVEAITAFHKKR
jgi:enoyl-CoA hydratase/carnithine racemase